MRQTVLILFIGIVLLACGKKNNDPIHQQPDTSKKDSVKVEVTLKDVPQPINDSTTTLQLNNMTLVISENAFYMDEEDTIRPDDDTLYLVQDLGAAVQGEWITVQTNLLTNIVVEQKFETSISLSFEGPHCDMIDWKHYTSPWKKLSKNATGDFRIDTISLKDSERFPKVNEKEFKDAIVKYCGKEALESFEGKVDIHTYPSWVGISRIFIRISGVEKNTQKSASKLLVILVPMGC